MTTSSLFNWSIAEWWQAFAVPGYLAEVCRGGGLPSRSASGAGPSEV
jgi:hypothetical protein